jgi:hypothetical protein
MFAGDAASAKPTGHPLSFSTLEDDEIARLALHKSIHQHQNPASKRQLEQESDEESDVEVKDLPDLKTFTIPKKKKAKTGK